MELNREEVKRAITLAKTYYDKQNYVKSKKLLLKALKMDPSSTEAKTMLQNVEFAINNPTKQSSSSRTPARSEPDTVKRSYTAEQLRGVQRITKSKSLYEVLGISRTASQSDIKKAYRKLALKFHPDKNGAPGADEAFKLINKSFGVLSDDGKRRDYDRFGEKGLDGRTSGVRRSHHFRHDDIDPEEIFRNFFGANAFGGGNVRTYTFGGVPLGRRRQRRTNAREPELQMNLSSLLQLLPIFFFLMLSFFSVPEYTTQYYNLNRSPIYSERHVTEVKGIYPDLPYFLKPSVAREIRRDRRKHREIELSVQNDHFKYAKDKCSKEKRSLNKKIKRAGSAKKKELMSSRLQWCDKVDHMKPYL